MGKKLNKIIVFAIIMMVCCMSIGYSALNKKLSISGDLIYRSKGDIRITNLSQKSLSNATIQYADYSKNEINFAYNAEAVSASVSYEIEVTNYTNTPMGILKIGNLPENATIDGYKLKETLKNTDGALEAGDSTTFTITFKASKIGIEPILLTFDFEPVYKVTYDGFSNTDNFKTEVIKGDNFSQDIGNSTQICKVTMNGSAISNYTFINGIIGISNVTGDILINGFTSVMEEPTTPNPPELNGEMIPVYYDNGWKKADVSNTDNSWYDYINQKWANAVTVVKSGYREKEVGSASLDISNVILPNYKSTNQGKSSKTSNLTLNFTAGSSGGTLSFDYKVSSESYDKLTLKVTIDDSEPEVVANAVGGQNKTGNYTKELPSNAKVTIVADYIKDSSDDSYDDTAYISNLSVPDGSTAISNNSTGDYPWIQEYKYYVGSKYEIDSTGKFNLLETEAHIFSVSDVGKYMCSDGSTTCTDLYEIVNVDENSIKDVDKYSTEQFNPRETYSSASPGTEISMGTINTMWVWVPRYSYTIKSEDGNNYYGKKTTCATPTQSLPGEIDVKFVSASTKDTGGAQYIGNNASGWRTNEAFDFSETDAEGNNTPTKRAGIWVGKFEPTGSYSATCKDETCNVSGVTILPNQASIRSKTVSNFFYMARSMQVSYADTYGFAKDKGDLHMMKNDEWGAVAYLSQSRYGKQGNNDYSEANKEVYINNNSLYITGTSGGGPSVSSSGAHYKYDDMTDLGTGKGQAGPGASTTGNITGIYDMSGGAYEYVMGVLEYDSQTESKHPGQIATGSSGFKGLNSSGSSTGTVDLPNKKYYNTYKSANPTSSTWTSAKPESACDGGVCYGHALSETGTTSGSYGWYQDYAAFVDRSRPWFKRGGYYNYTTRAGVFFASSDSGYSISDISCRLVLL